MLPSGIFMLPSKFGYIITGRYPVNGLDSRDKGASTLLVSTGGNEVVSPSFYCSVNVSVIKNPDLERFWSLETIGIKKIQLVKKVMKKQLRSSVILSSLKREDTRLLGPGN